MLFQWDCRNRNPVLLLATKSSTRKQVLLLKTLSKQLNAIPMGLSKQKSSHRNDSYKIATHTRKQVILLKTLSKQRNVISMGLSKQEFCTLEYSI